MNVMIICIYHDMLRDKGNLIYDSRYGYYLRRQGHSDWPLIPCTMAEDDLYLKYGVFQ